MSEVTFIIPVKIDSPERLNNLDFCVNFLWSNFRANIILVEEDDTSKIMGRYHDARHDFTPSLFPIFQRTRLINKAVNEMVTDDVICLCDMDVFIDPYVYRQAMDYLKDYSVVYPFNGKFYEISNKYALDKDLQMRDIAEGDKMMLNGNAIGAMVFFRTEDFINGGMENENFLGWGYEDNERFVRFTKLGFRIKRMDNPIYHFYHPRGINSSGLNPNVIRNRDECAKIERMTRNELRDYIDKTFHWCKKRKIMKISIVIPTYDAGGREVDFVRYGLGKILEQTFTDYTVVIADHSEGDAVKNLVESYRDDRFTYLRNTNNRGSSSANLNFGVTHAGGDIIKPMFHDDFFCNPKALELLHRKFVKGAKWVVCGSNDTTDRHNFTKTLVPSWNDEIVYGKNTIGSPSCVAYLRDNEIKWDERLLWLVDCKFYREMYDKHGLPTIEPELLVSNFSHDGQLSHTLSDERKTTEVNMMKEEYPR